MGRPGATSPSSQLILHLNHGTELAAAAVDDGKVDGDDAELAHEVVAALDRTRAMLSGGKDGAALSDGLERLDAARTATMERLGATASAYARRGTPPRSTSRWVRLPSPSWS